MSPRTSAQNCPSMLGDKGRGAMDGRGEEGDQGGEDASSTASSTASSSSTTIETERAGGDDGCVDGDGRDAKNLAVRRACTKAAQPAAKPTALTAETTILKREKEGTGKISTFILKVWQIKNHIYTFTYPRYFRLAISAITASQSTSGIISFTAGGKREKLAYDT